MKTGNIYVVASTPREAEETALRFPNRIHHDPNEGRQRLDAEKRATGRKGIYLFTLAARVEALRSEPPIDF